MALIPQPNRIHPPVMAKAASGYPGFVKHMVSANTRLSLRTVLVIIAAIALLFVILWLID